MSNTDVIYIFVWSYSIKQVKASGFRSQSFLNPKPEPHLVLPLENGIDTCRRASMSVERGGSFQEDGSTTILLEDTDRLRSDHISPLRRAQNMWKTNMHNVTIDSWSQAGSSFEEASGHPSLLDVVPVKNQMKGHLTPPNLSTYQTVSLDIPSCQASLRPNLMPGESITSACQLQCASLDISPTSITGATKKLKQSKPITPISIHIRRPTVKASVHGRNI